MASSSFPPLPHYRLTLSLQTQFPNLQATISTNTVDVLDEKREHTDGGDTNVDVDMDGDDHGGDEQHTTRVRRVSAMKVVLVLIPQANTPA
jgi:hypothetical protein